MGQALDTQTPREDDGRGAAADMPVGEILRRTRLHYGRSVAEVENHIRIRAHLIEAIEEGDLDKLPGPVYAMGFLRAYAEYLGLDGEKIVALFKEQAGSKAKKPDLHVSSALQDGQAMPLWIIVGALILALFLAGIWAYTRSGEREAIQAIPALPPEAPEPAPEGAALEISPAPAASEAAATPQNREGIILHMKNNSWVEIREKSGRKLISRVLKAGDTYFVPDRPDLVMSLGNAAGVEIEVDGARLNPLGDRAEVRREIPLDIKFLQEHYGSR